MLSREWKRVDPTHQEIVEKYLHELPVRLGAMARELGISVKLSSLAPDCSGLIMRANDEYVIKINRHESKERQRFTLAHEISHFLLHRQIIDNNPNGIVDSVLYRSGEPETVEFEANRLAAELVMPKTELNERLNSIADGFSEEALEHLASEFGVSKSAMEIRLTT